MPIEQGYSIVERVSLYRALGDETRLAIIDALWTGDHTPAQLREVTGLQANLVTFHLDVLEQAGLVSRRGSQGDGRRRYVRLEPLAVPFVAPVTPLAVECVLFICTNNAARSQFAAALWRRRTGGHAVSAGTNPADRVDPRAVSVAADHGLDLSEAQPRHVADVDVAPDLVISVCDRANEAGPAFDVPHRHWSIPDPLRSDRQSFEAAYQAVADRIERLATERAA